jgi:hypothetical protein
MKKNQNKSVQNTVLESKEEDEQTVVVVLKFASETLLSPSNIALVKRNPSLRPATKSSELIKFARRVKLCFVHLCYGWLGGLQGFQLELSQNILVLLKGESRVSEVNFKTTRTVCSSSSLDSSTVFCVLLVLQTLTTGWPSYCIE